MSDRGGVVTMWAKSLPRAVGLQYNKSDFPSLKVHAATMVNNEGEDGVW